MRYIARNPEPRRRVESKPKQNPAARCAEYPEQRKGVWKEGKRLKGKEWREKERKEEKGRKGHVQETPGPFPPGNV
jgi:hypothetical protein